MENLAKQLTKEIEQVFFNEVIPVLNGLSGGMLESYLELRETTQFDTDWVQADETIQNHIKNNNLDTQVFETFDEILRENIFKQAIISVSDFSDIASYLSDDAGLIFANQYFDIQEPFAKKMYQNYQQGNMIMDYPKCKKLG